MNTEDKKYMEYAIELAKNGIGRVNPNPLVGAVIVKKGRIIGIGYHEKYGQLHAERNAIANLTESAEDATIYVTLEPCCHYGKTPPCTEAIIENRISRVVIGSRDPNPLVSGKGAHILRSRGIEVIEDFMKDECDKLNPVFFHYITNSMPYVVVKYAMTMDGKIATRTGASKWITSEKARENVHYDRHRYSAIMAGIGTVLADNPMLTARIPGGRNPVRIICDSRFRIPTDCNIAKSAKEIRTFVAACTDNPEKEQALTDLGIEIIKTKPDSCGHVDLKDLCRRLAEKNIDSIYIEGGSRLNYSALSAGIVNKVHTYIAPKIFGGELAKSPVSGLGAESPDQAFMLINQQIKILGKDILIESEVQPCLQE